MPSKNQIRITIPKWVADLKGWNKNTDIEFVPITKDDDKPITKETVFILKEVKND